MMRSAWKLLIAGGLCFAAGAFAANWWRHRKVELPPSIEAASSAGGAKADAHLSDDLPDTVVLPLDVMKRLAVRTAAVEAVPKSRPLRLPGSLMLDSNRLARVHSRFEGHVMSLGALKESSGKSRPLQFGDAVKKDQVLAVLWSKEIGQKKSELLDAYSALQLSKATLEKLRSLRPGEVAEHVMRDAQRAYESALISSQNGERTLRSWQLSDADVDAIRKEAERLHREGASEQATAALKEGWAELQVASPIDGIILEKNIVVGELVDAGLDLFKIGDCSRLMVVANVYEEDYSEVERLPAERRRWKLTLPAEPDAPPIDGTFELAGRIIDPVQHTAQIVGWIDNPAQRFIAGQFISATVELLPRMNEVAVPTTAVIESGEGGVVYTVGGEQGNEFTRRLVAVAHRGRNTMHLRTALSEEEQVRGFTKLSPGERIVAAGVVVLEGTWRELGLSGRKPQAPAGELSRDP
ncbi:MAG: efflux RND transporter periplasmic adaptor subunit [Planctomycetaceae bacterium]|nr:efflux RND transporter periplasmic adaptor subunit [Planctomycetaceae bacterium]